MYYNIYLFKNEHQNGKWTSTHLFTHTFAQKHQTSTSSSNQNLTIHWEMRQDETHLKWENLRLVAWEHMRKYTVF